MGYLQSNHILSQPFYSYQVSCLIALGGNCVDEAYDLIQTVTLKASLSFILQQGLAEKDLDLTHSEVLKEQSQVSSRPADPEH